MFDLLQEVFLGQRKYLYIQQFNNKNNTLLQIQVCSNGKMYFGVLVCAGRVAPFLFCMYKCIIIITDA